ncbi:MAG: hypothetical protein R3F54_21380 [Alphaproteobacteria bacterium]
MQLLSHGAFVLDGGIEARAQRTAAFGAARACHGRHATIRTAKGGRTHIRAAGQGHRLSLLKLKIIE